MCEPFVCYYALGIFKKDQAGIAPQVDLTSPPVRMSTI